MAVEKLQDGMYKFKKKCGERKEKKKNNENIMG